MKESGIYWIIPGNKTQIIRDSQNNEVGYSIRFSEEHYHISQEWKNDASEALQHAIMKKPELAICTVQFCLDDDPTNPQNPYNKYLEQIYLQKNNGI